MENDIKNSNARPFGYTDVLIAYVLYGLSFFTVITGIAALIYAYIKRDELKNTIYYSHMNYIIRTFWWMLAFTVLGTILSIIYVGVFIIFVTGIWGIYRGIKGFIYFKDGRAIN